MSETAADGNPIAETTERNEENEAPWVKNDDEVKIESSTKSIERDVLENPSATKANQVSNNAEEEDEVAVATTSISQDANKASENETDAVIKEIVPTDDLPEATKIAQLNEEPHRKSDADANARNEPEDDVGVEVHNTTTAKYLASKEKSSAETIKTTTSTTLTTNSTSDTTTTTSTVKTTTDASDEYAEHITYTDDGNAIYTDPKTCHKYKWCTKENSWLYWMSGGDKLPTATNTTTTTTSTSSDNPYENEHYKWCSERNQWIPKTQKTEALTATQTETEHYKWDAAKHAWIPKVKSQQTATASSSPDAVTYGIDEDGQRIYTDKDGMVFFWDAEKSAWFPRIDDDFMARYQMSYGFIDNTSASEAERKLKEEVEEKRKELELQQMAEEAREATEATAAGVGGAAAAAKRKAVQEPPTWFELNPEQNTKVYVSNLPLDITLDEFNEVMSKCGMIMRDPQTQKHKLKLYTEADGQLKGDGLCDYIKVESVNLALKILDEYEVRGHKIRVQRAKFQMRGEYNPALKPKRKKKDKEKLLKMKEKLFDWRPEKMRGERSKNEKVVILKNLFTPELFEKEVQLILDYTNDLREECSKCGTVRKVVIYDLHPEGVAQINMASPEEADLVIQMMQGRYFGKRQLTAEHWDGKTKYKMAESEIAVKSRLNNWDEFLETDEDKKPDSSTAATPPAAAAEIEAEKQLEEQYFD